MSVLCNDSFPSQRVYIRFPEIFDNRGRVKPFMLGLEIVNFIENFICGFNYCKLTREEFKTLFDKYFDAVRSYLVYRGADRDQASDLAQDVFMRVWEKQMKLEIRTASRLLYKIAGDMFITRYRREKLEINYRAALINDETSQSPEEQMSYNELRENYLKALALMNEKQRIVFMMARMEGLKYTEIAARLDLGIKAVEKRMSLALAFLKKALNV